MGEIEVIDLTDDKSDTESSVTLRGDRKTPFEVPLRPTSNVPN